MSNLQCTICGYCIHLGFRLHFPHWRKFSVGRICYEATHGRQVSFVGGLLNQMFSTFSMFCCVAMCPGSHSILSGYHPKLQKLKWIYSSSAESEGWNKLDKNSDIENCLRVRLQMQKQLKALNATSVSFPVRMALFQDLFGSLWNPTQPVGDSGIFWVVDKRNKNISRNTVDGQTQSQR